MIWCLAVFLGINCFSYSPSNQSHIPTALWSSQFVTSPPFFSFRSWCCWTSPQTSPWWTKASLERSSTAFRNYARRWDNYFWGTTSLGNRSDTSHTTSEFNKPVSNEQNMAYCKQLSQALYWGAMSRWAKYKTELFERQCWKTKQDWLKKKIQSNSMCGVYKGWWTPT